MLNEVRKLWLKRTVQTAVFIPYFLNWVIIGGIFVTLFANEHGLVNKILELLFDAKIPFLYEEPTWVGLYVLANIWKSSGFWAIIYLAALSGINPSLYEAATMDGAGKLRQIWHISLPGIRSIIVMLFILKIGDVMEVAFDPVWVMRNPVVSDIAEVISTYVYSFGIRGGYMSLSAAAGMFDSLVGLVLILVANTIARRFNESLW
jgi:putative aldouronate transport system permease protein